MDEVKKIKCPSCGFENPSQFNFCGRCGFPLSSDVKPRVISEEKVEERRNVAIIFADISGFTRLSLQYDPEELKNIISRAFDRLINIIQRYGGYIDKIIGDCIMALFGTPVSHEDDPLRSVLCALELKEEIKLISRELNVPLNLSIGINWGLCITGDMGIPGSFTVMGKEVNFAERLQESAPPGTIFVSKSLKEITEKEIKYIKRNIKIKGFEEPVEVYEPVEVLSTHILREHGEFFDRENEIKILKRTFEEVKSGKGRILYIHGEAGAGKTSLVENFLNAVKTPVIVLRTEGTEYLKESSFYNLREILKNSLKYITKEKERTIFKTWIKWFLGNPLSKEESKLFRYSEKEEIAKNVENVIIGFLKSISKNIPLIIIIDDAQWVDKKSLDFFLKIRKYIGDSRILLIIISRRAEEINSIMKGLPQIEIKNFSENEVREWLMSMFNVKDVSQELLSNLQIRCHGNPFCITEFIKLMKDEGSISIEEGRLHFRGSITKLPAKISQLILSRFDRLTMEEKMALKKSSVLGIEVGDDFVEYWGFERVFKGLSEKGFLKRETNGYRFRDPVIRDVIYSTLLIREKKDYHREVAELIKRLRGEQELELMVYHYEESGEKEKFLINLKKLAERKFEKYEIEEAEKLYHKLLKEMREDYRIKGILGEIKLIKGEFKEAFSIYSEIIENKDLSTTEKVKYLISRAEASIYMADYDRAEKDIELSSKLMESIKKDDELKMELLKTEALLMKEKGKFIESLHIYMELIKLHRELNKDENLLIPVFEEIGKIHYFTGSYKKAYSIMKKLTDIKRKIYGEEHPSFASTYGNLGVILLNLGRYLEAEEIFNKVYKILSEIYGELHPQVAAVYTNIALVHYYMEDYKKAEEFFIKSLELKKTLYGAPHPESGKLYDNLGVVYKIRGEYVKAEKMFKKAISIFEDFYGKEHPLTNDAYINMGTLYMAMGNYKEAIKFIEISLKISKNIYGENHIYTAQIYNNLGIILENLGRYRDAESSYEKALSIYKSSEEENLDTVAIYNNLGSVNIELGEFEKSQRFITEAMDIIKRIKGEESQEMGKSLLVMSELFYVKGEIKKSLELINRTREIFKRISESSYEMTVIDKLTGMIYMKMGESKKGLGFLLKALKSIEKMKNKALLSEITIDMGESFIELDMEDRIKPWIERSLEIFQEIGNPAATLKALSLITEIKLKKGEDVKEEIKRIKELLNKVESPLILARVYLTLWRATSQQNYLTHAEELSRQYGFRLKIPER